MYNISREEQNNRLLKVLEYAGINDNDNNLCSPPISEVLETESIEELSAQLNSILQQQDHSTTHFIKGTLGRKNSQSIDISNDSTGSFDEVNFVT